MAFTGMFHLLINEKPISQNFGFNKIVLLIIRLKGYATVSLQELDSASSYKVDLPSSV